jgi:hypothetical protein
MLPLPVDDDSRLYLNFCAETGDFNQTEVLVSVTELNGSVRLMASFVRTLPTEADAARDQRLQHCTERGGPDNYPTRAGGALRARVIPAQSVCCFRGTSEVRKRMRTKTTSIFIISWSAL